MSNGRDRQGPSEGDPTMIDEATRLGVDLSFEGQATNPYDPAAEVNEGQETMIWEGTPLEYPAAADETTRALDTHELEEVPPPQQQQQQQQGMSYVDPRAWFLGRSFGGFRIVCELAAGGMATVFLGRKEGPGRVSKHAAVKVVHPHLAFEREFVDMFLDEARIAACVTHPNVCRVLDFGMAEGTYYLAMEYLLGETWSSVRAALADHPDGQRMLPTIAAHVVAQACEGLHAAHEAFDDEGRNLHIVHRDISPQNIFVAYDGTVRVLDFGIARAADRITSTRDGMLKGRLAYMSPEQMANEPITRAADIWSIGVVLREAIEGKRLFRRGTDAETMFAVTSEPMPAWSVEVPTRLKAAAERALERAPTSRYMTAHDMALDLNRFVSGERRTVSTSELSSWMQLLFGAQIEQKRALLQLPIPTPQGGPAQNQVAQPSQFPGREPLSGTDMLEDIEQVHAERPRRRFGSLNVSALLALGTLGAVSGIVLGKLFGGQPEPAPPAVQTEEVAEIAPPPSPPSDDQEPTIVAPAPPTPAPAPAIVAPAPPMPAPAPPMPAPAPPTRAPAPATPAPAPSLSAQAGDDGNERGHDSSARHRRRAEREAARAEAARAAQTAGQRAAEPSQSSGSTGKSAPVTGGAPGTVMVAFDGGWAEVYLGDRLLGTTPGRFSVPSGKQTLTIKPFGTGKAFAKRAEVKPGEVTKLFLSASE